MRISDWSSDVCSSDLFDRAYREGRIELELVPQGNLAERIRAAGAGIGGFYTPTGYGTELARGKETREVGGRMHVLESPLHADFAFIKAERGARWGNPIGRACLWARVCRYGEISVVARSLKKK